LLAGAFVAGEAAAGVPWWRRARVHANRYRTLYGIAVAVLAVLLLRSPVPLPAAESADEATVAVGDALAAPAAPAPDSEFPIVAASPLDIAPVIDEFPSLDAASVTPAPQPVTAASNPLRVQQGGYASVFAGTPLEQAPPGDGYPVETLAGSATKYSFVRLAGGGSVLRLRMLTDEGASLNDATAQVEACHITTGGWAPSRGETLNQAPKYNGNDCVRASRDTSGVWTFRFALGNALDREGWALVPVTGDNATFRVTFSPAPVTGPA
jgi:hypothetical protein